MSLSSQIVSGSLSALNLIKNFLANPVIGAQEIGLTDTPVMSLTVRVPIQAASYKEVGDADASSSLIINQGGGKNYITDNIAPKPRVWEVSGFIGTNVIENLAGPLLQAIQQQRIGFLRQMRESRQMLCWRTANGEELVWVAMKHLELPKEPLIQNHVPVSMTLQEIPILTFNGGLPGIPSGSANLSADPVSQGIVTANQIQSFPGISILGSLF